MGGLRPGSQINGISKTRNVVAEAASRLASDRFALLRAELLTVWQLTEGAPTPMNEFCV